MSETGLTAAILRFVREADTGAAGPVVAERALLCVLDTVGCILAGSASELEEPLGAFLASEETARGRHVVAGTAARLAPELAAMVNGSFGHALDYDDTLSMMPAHPSTVVLPALFAASDDATSGAALLDAYIVGIEVGAKIGLGISNSHYRRGFHATGTLAIFSAVAALARLLRLDEAVAAHALGIAASMASGVRCNFGTMTKPFHAGWAAHNAVMAVRLARCGMSAHTAALEAEAGFVAAYGTEQADMRRTVEGLANPWVFERPGIALKKYPCIYALHRPIDALIALRAKYALTPENTALIECRVAPGVFRPLLKHPARTGLEGKFSMEYVLAVAAVDGVYDLNTFTDANVARPEIAAVLPKVRGLEDERCIAEEADPKAKSAGTLGFVEVTVRRTDGAGETVRVDKPTGSPEKPLGMGDIADKFRGCATFAGLSVPQADGLFAAWRALSAAPSVPPLIEMLAKEPR